MAALRVCSLAVLVLVLAACGAPSQGAPAASAPASAPAPASAAAPSSASAAPASTVSAPSSLPSPSAASAPASSAAAASDNTGQNLTKIVIPYQAVSVTVTPFWVAVDNGLFRRYGLDVSTELVSNSPALVASMEAGQVPMANAGEDAVIGADLNGGGVAIVASGVNKLLFSIVGSSRLSGIPALKGKKLGVTRLGASTDFAARYALQQDHLIPGKDVTLLQLGGQPELVAGLASGAIDAAVLAPPNTTTAKEDGFDEVADLSDSNLVFYQSPLVAEKSWLAAHPELALDVVKGYLAGVARVHTDKQAALASITKYTKTTDTAALEDAYSALVKSLPRIPMPEVAAIQTGLNHQTSATAKTADPASFIDPSLIQQLQRSGFIDQLYK